MPRSLRLVQGAGAGAERKPKPKMRPSILPPLAKSARSGAPGQEARCDLESALPHFSVPTFTKNVKVGQPPLHVFILSLRWLLDRKHQISPQDFLVSLLHRRICRMLSYSDFGDIDQTLHLLLQVG